jgi:cytochrome bd ubiquinol oxidase subunit II
MAELWFFLLAGMLTAYAVLDGFDLGAGLLHRWVARTDEERRTVFAAIGPFWDGNEVWLLASGGAMFLAFPSVLASALSGFYLAIFLVIWLLLLRGISIELRSHVNEPLWRAAWDTIFCVSSGLLAFVLGAALANVVRGVPLDETGYFALPFFTTFRTTGEVGIVDWYTALGGLFSTLALGAHGAVFLAWKTEGPVRERSLSVARRAGFVLVPSWLILTAATFFVRPDLPGKMLARPAAALLFAVALAGGAVATVFTRRGDARTAFLGSCAFLAGLLATTAAVVFPVLLRSTLDLRWSLDVEVSHTPREGLVTGLTWWLPAFLLVLVYFFTVFRTYRGKLSAGPDH